MSNAAPLRHLVVFKYRAGASAADMAHVSEAFRALQHSIPGIRSFEQGANTSPEGKDQGFSHVFLLTFENSAARDAYLPHPAHDAFGALLGQLSIVEDVFVVDYAPEP